jgi:hypothetical protein
MKLRMTPDVRKYATILKFPFFFVKTKWSLIEVYIIFKFDGDN